MESRGQEYGKLFANTSINRAFILSLQHPLTPISSAAPSIRVVVSLRAVKIGSDLVSQRLALFPLLRFIAYCVAAVGTPNLTADIRSEKQMRDPQSGRSMLDGLGAFAARNRRDCIQQLFLLAQIEATQSAEVTLASPQPPAAILALPSSPPSPPPLPAPLLSSRPPSPFLAAIFPTTHPSFSGRPANTDPLNGYGSNTTPPNVQAQASSPSDLVPAPITASIHNIEQAIWERQETGDRLLAEQIEVEISAASERQKAKNRLMAEKIEAEKSQLESQYRRKRRHESKNVRLSEPACMPGQAPFTPYPTTESNYYDPSPTNNTSFTSMQQTQQLGQGYQNLVTAAAHTPVPQSQQFYQVPPQPAPTQPSMGYEWPGQPSSQPTNYFTPAFVPPFYPASLESVHFATSSSTSVSAT